MGEKVGGGRKAPVLDVADLVDYLHSLCLNLFKFGLFLFILTKKILIICKLFTLLKSWSKHIDALFLCAKNRFFN